jgi:hypothetical protein
MIYADLIDAMRRNHIRTAANDFPVLTREQLNDLAIPFYDLGGMFVRGQPDHISDDLWEEYESEVLEGNWLHTVAGLERIAIGFRWRLNGKLVSVVIIEPIPQLVAILQGTLASERVFIQITGNWYFADNFDRAEVTAAVACLAIRDAELNVEYVERPEPRCESVNRGRAKANLSPIPRTRVISLSALRKRYLPGSSGTSVARGGTHAKPREHVRFLSRKFIKPKNRNGWWREEKVVTINPGVTSQAVTRVVP